MGCLVQLTQQCIWLLVLRGNRGPAYLQQGTEKTLLAEALAGPRGEAVRGDCPLPWATSGSALACPAQQPLAASTAAKSGADLLPMAATAPASVVMATGCHTCRAAVSGTNL